MVSEDTIYTKIGGEGAIEAVVSDFYDRVLSDPMLEPYFEEADMDELHDHQVRFISAATGGPVDYDGRDMERAYEGLGITGEAFLRITMHFTEALEENGIPDEEIETIMETVAKLKGTVVEQ